jgi:hypothetical protein
MRITARLAIVVAGCGSNGKSSLGSYAVGTYIGGGSFLMGSDDCKYEGGPGVFAPSGTDATPSATPANGPRFISAPGRILVHCPKTELEAEALLPTGVKLDGPATIARGGNSDGFSAHLAAGGKELMGEGAIDWTLGKDCEGIATYGVVSGAQDTGGRDRTRRLVPAAAGKCTVIVTITTGSSLYASFKPVAFQAETLVTIQ